MKWRKGVELREPIHKHLYRVIYGDTDTGGVVYYGSYMRLFETGRTEYLRHIVGLSYRGLEEEGVILPVVETWCRYKFPARYDDLLEISTCVAEMSKVSITFYYEIRLSGQERLVAKGITTHAPVDQRGNLIKMPLSLVKKVGKV